MKKERSHATDRFARFLSLDSAVTTIPYCFLHTDFAQRTGYVISFEAEKKMTDDRQGEVMTIGSGSELHKYIKYKRIVFSLAKTFIIFEV